MSSDEDSKKYTYSDEIDSDVEVELYSMVHYESNLSASNLCTPLKSSRYDWNSSQQNESLFECESNLNLIRNDELAEVCEKAVEVELNVPFNSIINENEKSKSLITAKFRKCIESNVVPSPTNKQKIAHLNNLHSPIQHEELSQEQNISKIHFEGLNSEKFQSQKKINGTRKSLNRPIIDGETAAEVERILSVPFINNTINENEKSKSLIEEKLQRQCIESNSVPPSSCKKKKPHLEDFLSPIQHEKSGEKQSSKKRHFEELNSEKFLSQKKKNRNTESSNQPIPDTYLEINDSDSDNYIIIDDDDDSDSSHQKSELFTNISSAERTNIFNIDSSSNDSLSSKVFNPTHGSLNGKISGKDPWHFAPLDEEMQSRIKCRLIMKKEYRCHKCYQRGHPTSFCPKIDVRSNCLVCCGQKKCMSRCKQNMCHKCHQMGHSTKQCKLGNITCNRCGMEGHQSDGCPDLWRRFHLTTNLSEFTTSKKLPQSSPIYCFNCGKKGHFGPHCEDMNGRNSTWKTWPSVVSYKNQSVSPPERSTEVTDKGKKKASQKNASKFLEKLKMKRNKGRKIKENNSSVALKPKSGEMDFPRNKFSKKDIPRNKLFKKDFPMKPKKKKLMLYNPGGHKDDILLTKKQIKVLDYFKKKGANLKSRFSKKAKNVPVDDDADF